MPAVPMEIGAWLGCFGVLLFLANQAFRFWGNLTGQHGSTQITPQPLKVQETHGCVDRHEFDKFVEATNQDIGQLHSKHGGLERGLRAEFKVDFNKLEQKIDGLSGHVAGLNTGANFTNQELAAIKADIKSLLSRH